METPSLGYFVTSAVGLAAMLDGKILRLKSHPCLKLGVQLVGAPAGVAASPEQQLAGGSSRGWQSEAAVGVAAACGSRGRRFLSRHHCG